MCEVRTLQIRRWAFVHGEGGRAVGTPDEDSPAWAGVFTVSHDLGAESLTGLPWGFLPIKQEHEAPLMAWRRWCLASLCFAAGRWPAALWRREGNLPNQTCGCLGLLGQPPAPSEIQGMSFPWRVRVKKNRSLLTSHASSAPAWQAQPLAQEADTPSPCCQGTATSASPWKSPLP